MPVAASQVEHGASHRRVAADERRLHGPHQRAKRRDAPGVQPHQALEVVGGRRRVTPGSRARRQQAFAVVHESIRAEHAADLLARPNETGALAHDLANRRGQRGGVARWHEPPHAGPCDRVADAGKVGGDDRGAAQHALDLHEAEALRPVHARQAGDVAGAEERRHLAVWQLSDERRPVRPRVEQRRHARPVGRLAQRPARRPREDQLHASQGAAEGLPGRQEVLDALLRGDACRDADDHVRARRVPGPEPGNLLGVGRVKQHRGRVHDALREVRLQQAAGARVIHREHENAGRLTQQAATGRLDGELDGAAPRRARQLEVALIRGDHRDRQRASRPHEGVGLQGRDGVVHEDHVMGGGQRPRPTRVRRHQHALADSRQHADAHHPHSVPVLLEGQAVVVVRGEHRHMVPPGRQALGQPLRVGGQAGDVRPIVGQGDEDAHGVGPSRRAAPSRAPAG